MSLSVFLSTPPKLTSDKCWLSNSNEKKRGRFDIAVIRQVTLVFRSPMLKGQISAKCQKLEMLCGPKYRGDSLKIHGTAWIPPSSACQSDCGRLRGRSLYWRYDGMRNTAFIHLSNITIWWVMPDDDNKHLWCGKIHYQYMYSKNTTCKPYRCKMWINCNINLRSLCRNLPWIINSWINYLTACLFDTFVSVLDKKNQCLKKLDVTTAQGNSRCLG